MSETKAENKKFRSISGKPVRIALTNGHVALVGEEWKPLPPMFHSEAYAKGCISEDMLAGIMQGSASPEGGGQQQGSLDAPLSEQERKEKIESVIRQMVAENNPEKFTSSGLPRADAVNEACGFTTTAEERTAALESITAE